MERRLWQVVAAAAVAALGVAAAVAASPSRRAEPGWVERARDARLEIQQNLRSEPSLRAPIEDYEFAKAQAALKRYEAALAQTDRELEVLVRILPPGSSARSEAHDADDEVVYAHAFDGHALESLESAERETGDKEHDAKENALRLLSHAEDDKRNAIAKLTRLIASVPATATTTARKTTTTTPAPAAKLVCTPNTRANAVTSANASPSTGLGGSLSIACTGTAVPTSVKIQAPGHTFARALPGNGSESCGAAGDTLTCTLSPHDSGNGLFGDSFQLYYSLGDSAATKGSCGITLDYVLTAGGSTVASGSVTQSEYGC